MNRTLPRVLGVLLGILIPLSQTWAQQVPPVREGAVQFSGSISDNRLTMTEVSSDYDVIMRGGVLFDSFGPGVTGQARLQQQPDGVDLVYTFTNTGSQPARLGRLLIGKFNLGNNIDYRDFRHVGEPVRVDYNNYAFQAFPYPHGLYSPVWVLQNQDYSIGISLQYPIMEYRHDARLMLGSTPHNAPPSDGPRGWFLEFRFANLGDETPMGRLPWPGMIGAGETRTYVVSIRVTRQASAWIRTLTPYRDYFRSMYGGVQYTRDPRPIKPVFMALDHLISADNPSGFENFGNKRPDRYGFRPWTDFVKSTPEWSRVMLWNPTGLYNQNREMNFPFQFASRWESDPHLASAFNEETGLPSLQREGITLGLWWGRSVQVSREWNSAQWEAFDPDNQAHVQAAFAEMDAAVRAGAKEIGLDTFNAAITPIWKLVPWLERMRENYPGVKFSVEPITCDLMHRLGPTFIVGWTTGRVQQESDLYKLSTPFYLADLLVPGHESWGAMSYHIHRSNNYPVTPENIQRDAERLASLGYVPIMFDDPATPRNIRAAESWLTTLPADVLRGSGWNVNFSTPSAFRRSDGRLVIIGDSVAPPPQPGGSGRPGQVGGWVPSDDDGSTAPGEQTPGSNPNAPGDSRTGPEDQPAATPIQRKKRQFNIDLRVHRGEEEEGATTRGSFGPARPSGFDIPGNRNMVTMPHNSLGGAKGRSGSNTAWLDFMARKGAIERGALSAAIHKLEPTPEPVSPGLVTVPSNKK